MASMVKIQTLCVVDIEIFHKKSTVFLAASRTETVKFCIKKQPKKSRGV